MKLDVDMKHVERLWDAGDKARHPWHDGVLRAFESATP